MGAEDANGSLVVLLLCGTGCEAAGATQGFLQPMPAQQVIPWFTFETYSPCTRAVPGGPASHVQFESCGLGFCFGWMHVHFCVN